MKIEKLPSGSYRVRKTYKGKVYSVVFENKPTQKEALQALSAEMDNAQSCAPLTFSKAYNEYLSVKSNVLSPSTIRGYECIYRQIPADFCKMRISDIEQRDIQKVINDYSANHSPKSTHNLNGLISAILGMYKPNMVIRTTLPQKIKNEPYMPTTDELKKIMEYVKGSQWESMLWLSIYGLRRSEIIALKYPDDLSGNILTVNKAIVPTKDNTFELKTTKTTDSTRTVYLDDNLVELIHKQGYFVKPGTHPNSLQKYLGKVEKALGIEHFSPHKLRHFYASEQATIGIPSVYIQQAGGWSTDSVLKSHYTHAMKTEAESMQKKYAQIMSQIMS